MYRVYFGNNVYKKADTFLDAMSLVSRDGGLRVYEGKRLIVRMAYHTHGHMND